MLELLFGAGVCFVMGKIADHDNQSFLLWLGVSALLCIAALLLLPLPYIRFLIAFVATFVAMIIYKTVRSS